MPLRPDGMATMADERSHMREMARTSPEYNYDIIMRDEETGERLGVTESEYTREEAHNTLEDLQDSEWKPKGVKYEIEER